MADDGAGAGRVNGRTRELQAPASSLDETFAAATLVLTGERGVDKTALLTTAVDRAATRRVHGVRGSGMEYVTNLNFAGPHQPVDPLEPDLRRLPLRRATIEVALGIGSGPAPDRLSAQNTTLTPFRRASSSIPPPSTPCTGWAAPAAPTWASSAAYRAEAGSARWAPQGRGRPVLERPGLSAASAELASTLLMNGPSRCTPGSSTAGSTPTSSTWTCSSSSPTDPRPRGVHP